MSSISPVVGLLPSLAVSTARRDAITSNWRAIRSAFRLVHPSSMTHVTRILRNKPDSIAPQLKSNDSNAMDIDSAPSSSSSSVSPPRLPSQSRVDTLRLQDYLHEVIVHFSHFRNALQMQSTSNFNSPGWSEAHAGIMNMLAATNSAIGAVHLMANMQRLSFESIGRGMLALIHHSQATDEADLFNDMTREAIAMGAVHVAPNASSFPATAAAAAASVALPSVLPATVANVDEPVSSNVVTLTTITATAPSSSSSSPVTFECGTVCSSPSLGATVGDCVCSIIEKVKTTGKKIRARDQTFVVHMKGRAADGNRTFKRRELESCAKDKLDAFDRQQPTKRPKLDTLTRAVAAVEKDARDEDERSPHLPCNRK